MSFADELNQCLRAGSPWKICAHERLASTMIEAQRLAEAGEGEFVAIIADEQTAGTGRFDRPWHSPAGGGLWMTALLRPALPPERAPQLTLTAAVAVAEALKAAGFLVGIKWPNDVLAADEQHWRRKLCGIRAEMALEGDDLAWVNLGIGLNVNNRDFPGALAETATSLCELQGAPVSRAQMAAAVLDRLEVRYRELVHVGFAPIRQAWLDHALGLGLPVSVGDDDGVLEGIARGLDEEGHLLVEAADKTLHPAYAGDLIFPTEPRCA